MPDSERYDLVLVGTGFASSFFLERWLERAPAGARALVLERGRLYEHDWQIANGGLLSTDTHVNLTPEKTWLYSIGAGGGSNCWWACTPRMMPADFELRSRYGVGRDWPVSYDELEPHYQSAEETMEVSGPADGSPFPRSRPYPQPPHRLSDPDRLLKAAFPDRFFEQPCARPTRPTAGGRPRCCASGVCHLCPINSKFTILNSMRRQYFDPRVRPLMAARVDSVDLEGGRATGVVYEHQGETRRARGDVVALGANGLFNPHILLRSGLDDPLLGRRLSEQVSVVARFLLDGVDNFGGSTSITGHGYMVYDGPHRRRRAAALLETWNVPDLRMERGRWRQQLEVKLVFEDLPRDESRVTVSEDDPTKPAVAFAGHSDYALAGIAEVASDLERVAAALPVEDVWINTPGTTEAHILGTVVMGDDPATSVVDRHLVHHRVRNLLVLGGSAFPTSPPANPTLTLSALSLWAADHLLG